MKEKGRIFGHRLLSASWHFPFDILLCCRYVEFCNFVLLSSVGKRNIFCMYSKLFAFLH